MKSNRPDKAERTSRCPTCRQPVSADDAPYRPFCCRRCKLVDLGKWLDGDYALPGEPASEEDLAQAEQEPADGPGRRR